MNKSKFTKWIENMYSKYFLNWVDDYEENREYAACDLCAIAFEDEAEFDKHIIDCYIKNKKEFKLGLKKHE